MGSMIGAQIELDVRTMVPEAKSERVTSVQILRLANAAYAEDICMRLDLPELDLTDTENTAAGTATVAFSVTDVLKIKNICITDTGQPLKEIDADEYTRMLGRSGDYTGTPQYYYRTGATTSGTITVRLYPTPDAVTGLTLNYMKRPAALTISTATAIDALFDQALVAFTASRVAVLVMGNPAGPTDPARTSKALRAYGEMLLGNLGALGAAPSVIPVPIYGQNVTRVMS